MSAPTRPATFAKAKPTPREYPLVDEHRRHYVHWPVQLKNGQWAAADVLLPTGYRNPEDMPGRTRFDTFDECEKGCMIHNTYHFGSATAALAIIAESMNNSPLL